MRNSVFVLNRSEAQDLRSTPTLREKQGYDALQAVSRVFSIGELEGSGVRAAHDDNQHEGKHQQASK